MNFILNTNSESFLRFFSMPFVWIAIVCTIVGVSMVVLARRIVRVTKKIDDVADNDKMLVTIKCVGIALLFVALLIIVLV